MPIQLEIDPTERLMRTTASGTLTIADLQGHFSELFRHGHHQMRELIDATSADVSAFSRRDILSLADYAKNIFNEDEMARRALVVGSDETLGAARVFSFCVAGWWRVGVFEDHATAETWLRES